MADPTTAAATVTSWPGVVAFFLAVAAMQAPGLISTIRTRRDARVIRAQTENSHADAEYPNLREQLDAMHTDIRTAATKADAAATKAETAATAAAGAQAALTEHVASDEAWKTSVEDDLARRRRPLLSWRY